MIYTDTKCHMLPCHCFILYIKETSYKSSECLGSYYHTPFQGSRLKIVTLAPTSLVCVSAMLLLPIVGNGKGLGLAVLQRRNVHTQGSWKSVSRLNSWKGAYNTTHRHRRCSGLFFHPYDKGSRLNVNLTWNIFLAISWKSLYEILIGSIVQVDTGEVTASSCNN